MAPRRALAGLAMLLAAALTLGGPVLPAPNETAQLASFGSAADDVASVRALDAFWQPQALSAANDEPLAPPPEAGGADAGHLADLHAAWPRPVSPPPASGGTIDRSAGQFPAFYSRGPPLRA